MRADGKVPHVVFIEFDNRFLQNMQLFGREDRIWRGRRGIGFRS